MNKKKLLALLMALVMTLSLVPVTAFAEGDNVAKIGTTEYATLADAIAAANASGNCTITILQDVDFSSEDLVGYKWADGTFNPLRISETGVTLDLNEHKFYNMGNCAIEFGSIFSRDGTIASAAITNGTLEAGKTDGATNSYVLLLGGVDNVTISNITTNGGINACAGTNATISDCVVNGTKYYTVCAQTGSHVAINGTTFTKNTEAMDNTVKTDAMFWVQGADTDEDCITDGNPTGAFGASSITLFGGTYSADPTAYVADGYEVTDNNDGTWTVSRYVAQIGDTKYETLEAAFAAAKDGDYIEVLADCSGNGIKAPQGKFGTNGLTVDFDGHTYTVDGETVGSTGTETNGFQLLMDNTITFKNGTITSEKAKILVQNYSNLTLQGMTLTLNNSSYSSAYTLSNNNGNVVIDGTTINANPAGGFAFDVCRYASYPSVSVTVQGDSVINGNIQIDATEGKPKDGFTLELYDCTLDGKIVLTENAKTAMAENPGMISKLYGYDVAVSEGCYWADGDAGYELKYGGTAVAVIEHFNEDTLSSEYTTYDTLQAAFDAAQDGDIVVLLQNIDLDGTTTIDKSITIDGNHKTVTAPNGSAADKIYYAFSVVDSEAKNKLNVAIKDLSLNTTGYQVAVMLNCDYYSEITLNNVDINCDGACVYANGHASASVQDCDFTRSGTYTEGKDDVYYSALMVGYGGEIIASDCKITGNGTGVATFPSGGTVTLYNTDITIEALEGVEQSGLAIWSRNEDYTNYPEYCRDSVITFHSGKVSGNFKITDKYTTGNAKDVYDAKIVIDGGIFSVEPDAAYIATGYQAIDNTDETTRVAYPHIVAVKEDDFEEVKDADNQNAVTTTSGDTTFSFATASTVNTDDVTYAIKTSTTVNDNTQEAYTPVQTDVVTKPAVSENAANVSSTASASTVNDAKAAVEASAASGTTKIQAKLDEGNYGDVNLLTTQAAANAITKAAAAYEGAANDIAKVEIQLQTELTSYTLADKGESVVTTALIYQVKPQAVLLDVFGKQLGDAETLTNSDLAAQNLTLKFELPVPDSAVTDSNKVIVTHRSSDSTYGDSTSLLTVQGEAGNYYVVIETTHFSEFELTPYVVDGTNELISASLTLGGSIDLNFYLKLQDDVTAVRFTFNGAATTVSRGDGIYDSVEDRYKFSIPVAAKDIYKDVTIELLNANDATQAFCFTGAQNSFANKFTYSVVEYVNYVKEHGSEAEKALASSLGTYGYYANRHLLKGETHPSYNTVSDSYDTTIINFKNDRYTTGANPISGSGMTLLLRSETVIAYRFDYNVDYSGYKFYFTHSYTYADGEYTNGDRYEVTPVHTGNYWYVESKGIPAAYLDRGVTFEIVSGDNVVYSTTYSPMIYGGSMLSKDTTSETLMDTIRAMYDYNRKAIVCFGS